VRLEIRNARVVDPASGRDAPGSIYVADGRIAALDRAPDGFRADESIDAQGVVACPGLVDLSARAPSLETEMAAAAAGGITTWVCPPDTDPPLDEPGLVEMLTRRASSAAMGRVLPLGALTVGLLGERLAEMAELADCGCVGFAQGHAPLPSPVTLYNAMKYASTFGFTVWLRPEEPTLAAGGVAHEGEVATRLGLPPIPVAAETIAVRTILELMAVTGARVHLERLSSAAAVQLVAEAKARGMPLTCDVAVHHLLLSDRDIGEFDSAFRMSPPLRSPADRDRLRAALAEGIIDAVCSDHTPMNADAKQVPFGEALPGATGLEVLLPLTLQWGREAGLDLAKTLAAVTHRPAMVLGIAAGRLAIGEAADLCLFHPQRGWRVDPARLVSAGRNTPLAGLELTGKPVRTLAAGRTLYAGDSA
jgi:dihydroorotase